MIESIITSERHATRTSSYIEHSAGFSPGLVAGGGAGVDPEFPLLLS